MLALVGQPSLHCNYAYMVYWAKGALRRNCRPKQCKTSFSPFWVFLFSRNPTRRFWGLIFWHFWAGRARHPGPPSQPQHVSLEFHHVGGWLTHGDLALSACVDFIAVAEHRLIPGLGVRVSLLSGHRLRRFPLMLVTRGLVSSVCVALTFFCYCSV